MLSEKGLQNVPDHQFGEGKESSLGSCESISVTRVMMLMAVLAVIAGCGGKGVKRDRFVSDPVDVVAAGTSFAGLDPRGSSGDPFTGKLPGVSGGGPDPEPSYSVDQLKVQKVFELSQKLVKGMSEEDLWHKSAELGSLKQRLVKYEGTGLNEIITPREYYDLVSSLVESPEDVRKVLIGLVEYEKDPDNVLPPAVTVLSRGFGDCDQQSNLAKELLRDLGRKGKHNYAPRVISIKHTEHAVCIFTGEDGLLYSLDQESELVSFSDITDASSYYKKVKGEDFDVHELSLGKSGVRIAVGLDPSTLEVVVDEAMLVDFFHEKDIRDTDFVDYLPDNWEEFKKIDIIISGGGRLGYERGRLHYVRSPDETEEFYSRLGYVIQKNYSDGRVELFSDFDGSLMQVNYPDGSREVFGPNGKVIRRIQGSAKEPMIVK